MVLGVIITNKAADKSDSGDSDRLNPNLIEINQSTEPTTVPVKTSPSTSTQQVESTMISDLYRHESETLSNSQIRYIIYQEDKQISYYKFLSVLENEKHFRDYFRKILKTRDFVTCH